jgi:hypothetical protein
MTFDLVIISVSERAVQCALEDGSPAFWLPRQKVEWRGALDPGDVVSVTIPRWLALKHTQLIASRVSTQTVLELQKFELDPTIATAEGSFPMAYDNDMSGALFKNDRKEKPSHADYRGDVTIDGRKYWLNGWIKETKEGKKYLSLSVKPVEQRTDDRRQPQRPAGGPSFADSDIPFAAEVR